MATQIARALDKNKKIADSRDRTSDLQIFSLTLSQLSYTGMLLPALSAHWFAPILMVAAHTAPNLQVPVA